LNIVQSLKIGSRPDVDAETAIDDLTVSIRLKLVKSADDASDTFLSPLQS
jgi:hypothetical protein